tara:strand:+ start:1027 stop:1224 length:198 start_codon:yes stop_codon:yes gene_type:complete
LLKQIIVKNKQIEIMKNLLKRIKYLLLGGRVKEISRVELTTGLICIHTLDKLRNTINIDIQKVYN